MTQPHSLFAWFAGIDCALVAGLLVSLLRRSWKRLNGPQIVFMIAQLLFLLECAASIDWDLAHDNSQPFAQFPFYLRLLISLPALALSNYAVWRLLANRAWPFPAPASDSTPEGA